MELSSIAVTQNVKALASQGKYPQAYQMVLDDLTAHNAAITQGDRDVLSWLKTAIEINSGAATPAAIAVRANNVAAVYLERGQLIDMFGPEQQAASNAIAKAFVDSIPSGGTIQNIDRIAQVDAVSGLTVLQVNKSRWGGAVPGGFSFATGLDTSDYYNLLSASEKKEANLTHIATLSVIANYEASKTLGGSPELQNAMIHAGLQQDAWYSDLPVISDLLNGMVIGSAATVSTFNAVWESLVNYGKSEADFYGLQSSLNNLYQGSASGNTLAVGPRTTLTLGSNFGKITGFDLENKYSWSTQALSYDLLGNQKEQAFNNDNGTSTYKYFSPTDSILNETKYFTGLDGTGRNTSTYSTLLDGTNLWYDYGSASNSLLGKQYTQGINGAWDYLAPIYEPQLDFHIGDSSLLQNYRSDLNSTVGLNTPIGAIDNSYFPTLNVYDFGGSRSTATQSAEFSTAVAGGALLSGPDYLATFPAANTDGLFSNSAADLIAGGWRIAAQELQTAKDSITNLLDTAASGFSTAFNTGKSIVGTFADLVFGTPSLRNIDPLLIDITGQGINLTNWINNNTYFDTNVGPDGLADGKLHHTSWTQTGTGIIVLDLNKDGKINDITETLSEFFRGGATPGHYADGLAALAALAKPGAATFNITNALIDPNTNVSYFKELKVWQDANFDGITDAGELKTFAQLGITGISLTGSGNLGESLEGSAVTNRTTYTYKKADGTSATGAIAAVNFQTNSVGDVTIDAQGGVIINSSSEGGATQANSYIDKNPTARTLLLNHSQLTDTGSGTVIGNGITAVFATNQNDIITVDAGDTTSYWLGGGIGAATLNGGAGNTMFLINSQTVVHGGSGFNIAQVTDSKPIVVDLAATHLNEVIGGAGNGVFNASGTTWNVFIQGGAGNNIIIGGAAHNALSGGTGDDLIEAGPGGSVIHAGSGTDVIYGGSGSTAGQPNSDIIYGGPGHSTVILGTNNSMVFAGTGTMTVIGNASGFSVMAFHGSYADYTVARNADGSLTVTDKKPGRDGEVTMKDVDAFDFSDIKQLDVHLNAGLPVNDIIPLSGNGPYIIPVSSILANDINYAGGAVAISNLVDNNGNAINPGSSGQVNGGTVSLSGDKSTITFTPAAGFNGIPSFRYHLAGGEVVQQVSGGGAPTGASAPMTATVTLLPPDAPTDVGITQEWYIQSANILAAWRMGYTGEGVSIGVFDPSGNVDFTNSDLTPNAGKSFTISGAPGIEHIGTHATQVAGVIGAARDGQGQVGVAYNATINSEAIPTGELSGNVDTLFSNFADWSKYDIVNNSWGFSPPFVDNFLVHKTYEKYFKDAATKGRHGLGTILIFAGGNDRASGRNTNELNTTDSRYAITVGGINAPSDLGSLQISGEPFSNPGASILVSAPANNISTTGTVLTNDYGQQFGDTSQTAAGTSLAAPIVSGVVALMLEANPNLTYREVQQILAITAKKVDAGSKSPYDASQQDWTYNNAKNWNGGGMHASDNYGFGEVDAAAAVRLALSWKQGHSSSGESSLGVSGVANNYTYNGTGFVLTNDQGASTPYIDFNMPSSLQGFNIYAEHIEVRVQMHQVRLADLTIKLVSASGVTSVLLNRPSTAAGVDDTHTPQDFDFTFDTVKEWGELGNQDYRIVVSYAPGTTPTGEITGASVNVYGAFTQSGDHTYYYTDEYATSPNSATTRDVLTDTGGNVTLNLAAIDIDSYLDLHAGSPSNIAARSFSIGAGTTVKTVFAGAGNQVIIGNDAGDTIYAGEGTVTFTAGAGVDQFMSTAGGNRNHIYNLSATDSLNFVNYDNASPIGLFLNDDGVSTLARANNNSNQGAVLHNLMPGQLNIYNNIIGATTLDVSNFPGALTIDLRPMPGQAYNGKVHIKNIIGNNDGDLLIGNNDVNNIIGQSGNDVIEIVGSNDTVDGGAGSNTIAYSFATGPVTVNLKTNTDNQHTNLNHFQNIGGSQYADTLTGNAAANVINGGGGDDTIQGGGGADMLDGGTGKNTLSYAWSTKAVNANLAAGTDNGGATLANFQVLVGSSYNDILTGSAMAEYINGGNGDDTIKSGGGNDTINGGGGINTISYNWLAEGVTANLVSGTDSTGARFVSMQNITGSVGNDVLTGNGLANLITGGGGNDTIRGGGGVDTLDGGAGTNTISYSGATSSITVNLLTGTDSTGSTLTNFTNVLGSNQGDIIIGRNVASLFTGGAGNDSITGGTGNDTILGGGGVDTLDGGAGANTVSYTWSTKAITANLTTGTDNKGSSLSHFRHLIGSAQGDTLIGDSNANLINGGDGDDTIQTVGGSDTVDGGTGVNTISYVWATGGVTVNLKTRVDSGGAKLGNIQNIIGSSAASSLIGNADVNVITGGAGNDTIQGGGGLDTLNGGAGVNSLSYAWSTAGITVSLKTNSDNLGTKFRNFQNITGSNLDDVFIGSSGANTLIGGSGNDTIQGGGGVDSLDGGIGNNTLSYAWSTAAITANLATGTDSTGSTLVRFQNIVGTGVSDNLIGNSAANVIAGGNGNDTIGGGGGADALDGGAGANTISYAWSTKAVTANLMTGTDSTGSSITNFLYLAGSAHADTLIGDSHSNHIDGGDGNDTILGGGGVDVIDGGAGTNSLSYAWAAAGVKSSLVTGKDNVSTTFTHIQNLTGSAYADTLTGDGNANVINGGDGDDAILGGGGVDTLDGGAGVNMVSYAWGTAGVTVNLSTGKDSTGTKLKNFANITGTIGDDALVGTSGDNLFIGNGGNDTFNGAGGNDTYKVAAGNSITRITNGASSSTAPSGELDVAALHTHLWFERAGNDLEVDVLGTSQRILVKNWYLGGATNVHQLQEIAGSDNYKVDANLQTLVQAMASFQTANPAFDPSTTTHTTLNDHYFGTLTATANSSWHA